MKLKIKEAAYKFKGWTMTRIAEELDLDITTVFYWNQGRSVPRLPMLIRVCKVIGCRIDDLIGDY